MEKYVKYLELSPEVEKALKEGEKSARSGTSS